MIGARWRQPWGMKLFVYPQNTYSMGSSSAVFPMLFRCFLQPCPPVTIYRGVKAALSPCPAQTPGAFLSISAIVSVSIHFLELFGMESVLVHQSSPNRPLNYNIQQLTPYLDQILISDLGTKDQRLPFQIMFHLRHLFSYSNVQWNKDSTIKNERKKKGKKKPL